MTLYRLSNEHATFEKSHVIPDAFFRPQCGEQKLNYVIGDGA